MAFPTAVNSQITDAVTQADVQVVGVSPAMALGNLYQATAQALANAAHNATAAQQQMWITAQAATTAGVALIYGHTASGVHTMDILSSPVRGLGAEAAPPPPPSGE
ncbi:glycerol-3-phosphate dehydrogenase [Sphingomonas suaedae]|uniref:Glycerol-3-phosphate dehydrogenase n=1 Tax=Sphingomonas suaedae TaxID=2599297 RepID=A0A518REQ9_9SPHN|nr:RebB family R body protein [Sphingomonas suaedae]QDX25957.1 glycerol-3-phosphate dehydrogenase [Sphingomonas suaedae]